MVCGCRTHGCQRKQRCGGSSAVSSSLCPCSLPALGPSPTYHNPLTGASKITGTAWGASADKGIRASPWQCPPSQRGSGTPPQGAGASSGKQGNRSLSVGAAARQSPGVQHTGSFIATAGKRLQERPGPSVAWQRQQKQTCGAKAPGEPRRPVPVGEAVGGLLPEAAPGSHRRLIGGQGGSTRSAPRAAVQASLSQETATRDGHLGRAPRPQGALNPACPPSAARGR